MALKKLSEVNIIQDLALFPKYVFNQFSGVFRRWAARNQEIGFPLGPRACQKSPLPPFNKGGLGGISEAGWPIRISWQISRFFVFIAHQTHHVLLERSPGFFLFPPPRKVRGPWIPAQKSGRQSWRKQNPRKKQGDGV
jgi:hypothetical protein